MNAVTLFLDVILCHVTRQHLNFVYDVIFYYIKLLTVSKVLSVHDSNLRKYWK